MYLGIDGGGSKTAYLLEDASGNKLASLTGEGISWREGGVTCVLSRLKDAFRQLLKGYETVGLFLCAGVPCYGENETMDAAISAGLAELLPGSRQLLVNDAVISWAGALKAKPGVSVVAGTGSLAYGRNAEGMEARCGGWSEHFSDEGSGYWLGLQAVNLYTRQADGRVPQGALLRLFQETLGVWKNEDFLIKIETEYLPSRKKVASLQRLLLEAARQGDASAIRLYELAAHELADMALAAARKLGLPEGFSVSCTGGLLNAGKRLTIPFEEAVRAGGGVYVPASATPVEGAVLLARESSMGDF